MMSVKTAKTAAAALSVCLAFLFALPVFADKFDGEAKKAREKKGPVIKCSPDGTVKDTVSFEEALKKLRSGSVLQLSPGMYNTREVVTIDQNNIVIEGDGSGGHVDLFLYAYGTDVVIRNIYLHTVDCGDAVIVDSKIVGLCLSNGGKKSDALVYNCVIGGASVYPNRSDMVFKNCTIVQAFEPPEGGVTDQAWRYGTSHWSGKYALINFGNVEKNGEVQFINCVVFSGYGIFNNVPKTLDISVENSLFYARKSLVFIGDEKKSVKDIKGLDEYFAKCKIKGQNLLDKPVFAKPPDPHSWHNIWSNSMELSPSSPGRKQGMGANVPPGKPIPAP
jgi:hypothetical protein